jgi:hypothetical protein
MRQIPNEISGKTSTGSVGVCVDAVREVFYEFGVAHVSGAGRSGLRQKRVWSANQEIGVPGSDSLFQQRLFHF